MTATDNSDRRPGATKVPPAPASQQVGGDLAVGLLAVVAETALAAAVCFGNTPLLWLLPLHGIMVALLTLWVWRGGQRGRDLKVALLLLIATTVMGPLGALGAVFAAFGGQARKEPPRLLEDWYERISHSTAVDPVTRQCDMVSIGRAIDLAGQRPTSFTNVMARGSLVEKQVALGLIARKFHPDYLPALQAALKCEQPVIRVQAAAVAAHVRGEVAKHLARLIGDVPQAAHAPKAALALAGQIENCVASGLLDENDRLEGRRAADQLYERSSGALEFRLGAGSEDAALVPELAPKADFDEQEAARKLNHAYEALLLRAGRFAELRALRGGRRDDTMRHYRIRPMPPAISSGAGTQQGDGQGGGA